MKTNHLSAWEQEEYILNQRTPQMLHHLTECAQCRSALQHLEQGVAVFRTAAVQWSSDCLANRSQQMRLVPRRQLPALRWAAAGIIPLVLLLLVLFPFHPASRRPAHPVAQISDDALLDQVDEQVSVAVPSSMESLTHLVSTGSSAATANPGHGSKHIVQTN